MHSHVYLDVKYLKLTCGMEDSVKNKLDSLFFITRLFVPQASQSSPYRRAKSDIWLAIPPALEMPAEWRIL